MIEAPLTTVVTRTNPSGMTTTTNASTISTVTRRLLVRRQPFGSRRSSCCCSASDGHQAPRFFRAERSTIVWAMTLMMIVKANRSTPIPISAARSRPVASPNWFAMTAAML